jgi:hypothetical protein
MGAIPGAGGLGGAATGLLGGVGGSTASQAAGLLGAAPGAHPQPAGPGQAEFDQARAACLSGRGYSVR